jgi:flavin reductase (DIM6/NTAB) family NADH-FMN oxidoreductase RutF
MKKNAELGTYLEPKPKVIVSCRGADGRNNALVVAYCANCSYDPPMVMVGVVPSRYSYDLIKETGCFVVNLPGKDFMKEYEVIGSKSGRDMDKFAELGLKFKDGDEVDAPVLLDCPVNIECTVVDSIVTGSHEMFVGKVEAVHADEKYLNEENKIDFTNIDLI